MANLAAAQKAVNYHLVLHHVHLATVLELQLVLGMKLNLQPVFDDLMQRSFFESLHTHPLIPMADANERVKQKRQLFLEEIVQNIGVDMNEEYQERWALVTLLCKDWGLDLDLLRIKVRCPRF